MVKIGLIGVGFMGGTHLTAYKLLAAKGNFKVTAIADLDENRAKAFAEALGAKIYKSGDELIQNADVNTVDICLPTFLHFEYAMKALDKGYNVFVEKPLAINSEDAKTLADKAKQIGVIAMVGQCLRFWDEYVFLKKLIDDKTYGKILNANLRRLSPKPTWGWQDWLSDKAKSGGAALDLHIHDTDYVLYAFGNPNKMSTIKNKCGERDSYIMTICEFDDFVVSLEGTWQLPSSYPFEMYYRVVFEKAVVEFSSKSGVVVYQGDKAEKPTIEKQCKVSSDNLGGNLSDLGGYYNELEYFTECLCASTPATRATLHDGLAAVEMVEKELKEVK